MLCGRRALVMGYEVGGYVFCVRCYGCACSVLGVGCQELGVRGVSIRCEVKGACVMCEGVY